MPRARPPTGGAPAAACQGVSGLPCKGPQALLLMAKPPGHQPQQTTRGGGAGPSSQREDVALASAHCALLFSVSAALVLRRHEPHPHISHAGTARAACAVRDRQDSDQNQDFRSRPRPEGSQGEKGEAASWEERRRETHPVLSGGLRPVVIARPWLLHLPSPSPRARRPPSGAGSRPGVRPASSAAAASRPTALALTAERSVSGRCRDLPPVCPPLAPP